MIDPFPGVRGFRCALLTVVLVMGAASSEAQPAVKQVLLLQSFDRGNLTIDSFTSNFRVELDRFAGSPVNVVQVVVGPTGFVGAPEQAIVDYIRATFAEDRSPDLIVTVGGPATIFARRHRQELFPEAPLLFAAVDERFLRDAPLGENDTAVAVRNDYPRFVEEILHLRPRTTQVFMVMGSGLLGRLWRQELEAAFIRFQGRLTFIWSNDLSLPEVLRRTANLPGDSAIFYFTFGTDASGAAYADERVLADLHAAANAPIFGVQSVYLGVGVVGGSLMSIDGLSRNTADVAVRLLNGAPPGSINVPVQLRGQPTFDWRELQRWGIAESQLPPGSAVQYRGPTLWREYRRPALIALGALVIQSLLIAGLLYQRRARQRAELDSRKNLAVAADASRRETMSALTSSIAHELSQPLTAMTLNAGALQMMVTANSATADAIGDILSDIQAQSLRAAQIIDRHRTMLRTHQLDRKPIDLHAVVNESLALVAHEMKTRRMIVAVELASNPCIVSGDQVLLQQVLVNLVMNAMEAMADTPVARRRITIRSEVVAGEVQLSVRDAGTGLPEHLADTLFTPFITTKRNGIGVGLTIVRSILDAHGGTIDVRNNPEGGATFTVSLHRSGMALDSLVPRPQAGMPTEAPTSPVLAAEGQRPSAPSGVSAT